MCVCVWGRKKPQWRSASLSSPPFSFLPSTIDPLLISPVISHCAVKRPNMGPGFGSYCTPRLRQRLAPPRHTQWMGAVNMPNKKGDPFTVGCMRPGRRTFLNTLYNPNLIKCVSADIKLYFYPLFKLVRFCFTVFYSHQMCPATSLTSRAGLNICDMQLVLPEESLNSILDSLLGSLFYRGCLRENIFMLLVRTEQF